MKNRVNNLTLISSINKTINEINLIKSQSPGAAKEPILALVPVSQKLLQDFRYDGPAIIRKKLETVFEVKKALLYKPVFILTQHPYKAV